jgi:hypothetical protein
MALITWRIDRKRETPGHNGLSSDARCSLAIIGIEDFRDDLR